jgi:CheY-like chemotaxis protein
MNFLLIDDDPIFNLLSRKLLERMGIASHIETVLNGSEAIELFNRYFIGSLSIPDVILLDINMPVMDGFSFLEAFRKLPVPNIGTIRIVIVTSSSNAADMRRAKTLGVDHYLVKPVTEEKLREALQLR